MKNEQQQTVIRDRSEGWERGLHAVLATLRLWHERSRTRRSLRELEMHRLADIGLTDHTRRREGGKWFWQN